MKKVSANQVRAILDSPFLNKAEIGNFLGLPYRGAYFQRSEFETEKINELSNKLKEIHIQLTYLTNDDN